MKVKERHRAAAVAQHSEDAMAKVVFNTTPPPRQLGYINQNVIFHEMRQTAPVLLLKSTLKFRVCQQTDAFL